MNPNDLVIGEDYSGWKFVEKMDSSQFYSGGTGMTGLPQEMFLFHAVGSGSAGRQHRLVTRGYVQALLKRSLPELGSTWRRSTLSSPVVVRFADEEHVLLVDEASKQGYAWSLDSFLRSYEKVT